MIILRYPYLNVVPVHLSLSVVAGSGCEATDKVLQSHPILGYEARAAQVRNCLSIPDGLGYQCIRAYLICIHVTHIHKHINTYICV